MVKILFIGDTTYQVYVSAFYDAAKEIEGVEADIFDTRLVGERCDLLYFVRKVELNLKNGFLVKRLNDKLLQKCMDGSFDFCFFYSCTYIYPSVVKKISDMGTIVATYCNDNPFSDYYPKRMWKKFIKSLRYSDITYSYRNANNDSYYRNGSKNVKLLMPYYIKKHNFYLPDEEIDLNIPEVVFIGHFEDDGRSEYIDEIINRGLTVGVNTSWKKYRRNEDKIVRLSSNQDLYNQIINKAKIAIVFLSTLNKDTYTRRCFEIPACKTLMISQYTEDLSKMYTEDEEIVFFRDKNEFADKIQYYLKNDGERTRIANNAYERLLRDGNEVSDRVSMILDDFFNLKPDKK